MKRLIPLARDYGAAIIGLLLDENGISGDPVTRLRIAEKIAERSVKEGIKAQDIIIDPGFGFGKTTDHNFEIMRRLGDFSIAGLPLLVGVSRKGMIWKTLNISADEALNGTSALNAIAVYSGADILRVHDVKEAVQVVKLIKSVERRT